jgi:hypothetical protein
MYYFVKENGIKATVEYQMNLVGKHLKQFNTSNKPPNEDSDEEKPSLKLKKKQSIFCDKENKRSVSLPAAKKMFLRRR